MESLTKTVFAKEHLVVKCFEIRAGSLITMTEKTGREEEEPARGLDDKK
jgi:hypothetical protein